MKNVLVIIRTCPKDDWIAYNCYNSFKSVMDCDFIFFAEVGDYKWIAKTKCAIIYHEGFGNYGGQLGLYGCVNNLKNIDVFNYEMIMLSDSDITMLKNPLEHGFQFGGIKSATNNRHFSGQLLMFDKQIWLKVINYPHYHNVINNFILGGEIDVADDTCLSWVATEYTGLTFDFSGGDYWRHEKLHHLEPFIK